MARAGETPSKSFVSEGYGTSQQANDLAGMFPMADAADQGPPEFTPQTPEEKFLFGPTDRPNEPITHGAPFGPGASYAPSAYESDDALIQRVAQQIGTTPGAAPELRAFAARVARGE